MTCKHRAKVVYLMYVCCLSHVYSMYKHRAKVLNVMLSCCALSWWVSCLAVVVWNVRAVVGRALFGAVVKWGEG